MFALLYFAIGFLSSQEDSSKTQYRPSCRLIKNSGSDGQEQPVELVSR